MEEKRQEQVKMLIKFYNMQASCSLRATGEANMRMMDECLERANGDVVAIKNHIRSWLSKHTEDEDASRKYQECLESFGFEQPAVGQMSNAQVNYSMGMLEQAVVQLISNMNSQKIEENIMDSVESKIQNFIMEEYGPIERKITTVIDDIPREMKGIQHEKFETVLKFVANDEPVFLTGPAGSGKNVLCKQVAEALGLKFYFTNAVTQEYKLTGFTDAMGNYQETQFYKAFTQGGVFMLDEMDASIPEVLVILNAAIANRYFDFPAPIGYVEAHPDFRVIAAGNTVGQGATNEYVGRNQLDGASLDRFAVIEIDYSDAIERNVALGNEELLKFCREYRNAARKNGVDIIVSYRGIGRLAKMVNLLSKEEALQTCLFKGLEKDDLSMMLNDISDGSFKSSMKRVVQSM